MPTTKDRYIKVCPKCKSPDIRQDKSTMQQLGVLPTYYICNECNFAGQNFPEVTQSALPKLKKVTKSNAHKKTKSDGVDLSYGKFEVRFYWKIIAPIFVLFGLISLFQEPILGIFFLLVGSFMSYVTFFKQRKLKDN